MTELVCDGVTVNLNGLQILTDVSFTLGAGSIVGLIGPNGAGKTTLLNVMAGKIAPSQGEVRLDGKPVSNVGRRHLAGMGVFRSFQEGRLFESLTAEENVVAAIQPPADERLSTALLRREPARAREDLVMSALEAADMARDRAMPAWKMSYGMRKRTVMGQAVAARARVYLLDEPLAGVDAATREKMLAALAALRDPERIVIVVEHDLEAIGAVADRVLLLDRGQIVGDGRAQEVLSSAAVLEAYLQ